MRRWSRLTVMAVGIGAAAVVGIGATPTSVSAGGGGIPSCQELTPPSTLPQSVGGAGTSTSESEADPEGGVAVLAGSKSVYLTRPGVWPPGVAYFKATVVPPTGTPATQVSFYVQSPQLQSSSPTCSIGGLSNSTRYTVRIQTVPVDGEQLSGTGSYSFTPEPAPPSLMNVSFAQTGSSSMTVSWQPTRSSVYISVTGTGTSHDLAGGHCEEPSNVEFRDSDQCTVPGLRVGGKYSVLMQTANGDIGSLGSQPCPPEICASTGPVTHVLSSRLSPNNPPPAKESKSYRYLFLLGGLLLGLVGGFLIGTTRRRAVPVSVSASPYVQVGPTESQAIQGSAVGSRGGGVMSGPASTPVVTANGDAPTSVTVLAHRVRAPRGTGLVVAAVDPVGFAEFDDGITRRIASMDGVPLAPGAHVRDAAVQKSRQTRSRK